MSAPNYSLASCILSHLNASEQCQSEQCEVDLEQQDAPSTMIKDYVESLEYINSCHTLINQIIQCRHPPQNICIPQMPNFLNVLTYIAKDVRGLSELKNLESLEGLMKEMNGGQQVGGTTRSKSATMGRSAQASCSTMDREVDACRPTRTNAETSTKRPQPEVRFPSTGIPRRIKTKERQLSPSTAGDSMSEASHFERRKTIATVLGHKSSTRMKAENLQIDEDIEERYSELSPSPVVGEISDKESLLLSNDDMDECAKQMLLASEAIQSPVYTSPSNECVRSKARRVKSKAKRDFIMIQNFLKQWGVDMPPMDGAGEDSLKMHLPPPKSSACMKCGDAPAVKVASRSKQLASKPELNLDVESDVDTTIMEGKMRTSRSSRLSTDSHHMTVLNDIAATAVGMESTFITNEEPVWHSQTHSPLGISDESDIEPDLVEHTYKEARCNNAKAKLAKTVTFQTNPRAAYVVTEKPQDMFLLPRRRRSQNDLESEQALVDSDIDDEIFDRKRRHKNALKLRPSVLPQQVLSNIGILTQTGQVKPEKERHLQEMRSRLASDMQTALFRKPRNRKMETDDIVHLHADIRSSNTET